jgi:uncharacterized membrane protein
MRPRRAVLAGEDGSLLPLTIFYGFLSLVLILLVVSATSLYLERKRLFTLADGAALVGAEAFALDDVAVTAGGPRPTLSSAEVDSAVRDYLATTPGEHFESLRLETARSTDGRSATVELSAYWRPPVISVLVPAGIRLDVTAIGRSVFQ